MPTYIDKDKVIEEVARLANRSMVGEMDEPYLDWKTVVSVIFDAQVADVQEVRHGKWVEKEYYIDGEKSIGMVCCHCGANQVAGLGLAKYCYMCGAKMDGKEA